MLKFIAIDTTQNFSFQKFTAWSEMVGEKFDPSEFSVNISASACLALFLINWVTLQTPFFPRQHFIETFFFHSRWFFSFSAESFFRRNPKRFAKYEFIVMIPYIQKHLKYFVFDFKLPTNSKLHGYEEKYLFWTQMKSILRQQFLNITMTVILIDNRPVESTTNEFNYICFMHQGIIL